ncbi:MAG: hypothetical protein ABJZ79_16540, partial [Parasphingorhabdus sp.]|uniref:hypothetical protein n=1 Tax=Parasphingorhabdus sp. TaxID=2709688 RepID=UPI003297B40F
TRSIRGVEIRGKRRLINDRHANLQAQRVNVTTPVGVRAPSHRLSQDRLQPVVAEAVMRGDAFLASFNGGDR